MDYIENLAKVSPAAVETARDILALLRPAGLRTTGDSTNALIACAVALAIEKRLQRPVRPVLYAG